MLFNSGEFLFAFLPAVLLAYFLAGRYSGRNAAIASLCVASLIFYGWWNPAYLPLIGGSILGNYLFSKCIRRARRKTGKGSVAFLTLGILFNLGVLGYFKYTNFFIETLTQVTGSTIFIDQIVLPLGISFFTFQQIAFLADTYQGKASEHNLLRYTLFVTFFPQLIAGPIVHHREVMPQFSKPSIGTLSSRHLVAGSMVFLLGLFKKVVLADGIAPYASAVFDQTLAGTSPTFWEAWTGALAYSCQIYFDFSAYSDMAVGLALMLGIRLPLNFNSPYKATGIIEFWRRWHMTLSRFLRDYVYIPLGGNQRGRYRRYINLMLVMLVGGLWHGAGWTFVAWGGLHGLFLIVNHGWRKVRGKNRSTNAVSQACSCVFTFAAVTIAWVFFRSENFSSAITLLGAMVPSGPEALLAGGNLSLPMSIRDALLTLSGLLAIVWLLPNTQQFMRNELGAYYKIATPSGFLGGLYWRPHLASALVLAAMTVITIGNLWQPSEFIYFQF